jgi:cullin 1
VGQIDENEPIKIYTECFEVEFLKRTRDFYSAEATEFLRENTVSDYMRKIEARLKEEQGRADQHLHGTTKSKLLDVCTAVLVEHWQDTFFQEFVGMVQQMYRLLERTTTGLQSIARSFQELIMDEGRLLIQAKCEDIAADAKNLDQIKKALPLIRDLAQLHTKYKQIVEACFEKNHIFTKALDQVTFLASWRCTKVFSALVTCRPSSRS